MKKIVAGRRGGPEVLSVEEVPDPVAADGQVLIKVDSAGINFADIKAVEGAYPTSPPAPWTPGHEVAGTDIATGEPVIAYLASGGYSELAVAEREFTFPAAGLDLAEAGGFFLVSLAAVISLRDAARLGEGETLVVTAGAGGIGTAAIQAGRLLGASRIVAIASTPHKRAFAVEHGADEAIGYDDPVPACDVMFDTIGNAEGFERRMDAVRSLGRIMLMGASSGKDFEVPDTAWLKARNVTAVVFSWGALRRRSPQTAQARAKQVASLIREGRLRPPVQRSVPMADVAEMYRLVLGRQTMGKVVIRPGLG